MRNELFLTMAVMAYGGHSFAQSMHQVPMAAYAQIVMSKEGKVSACGYEVVGVDTQLPEHRLFDTSLYIYANGHVLGKVTGKEGDFNKPETMKSRPVEGGWFRAEGTDAATPQGKLIEGETPGTKLFQTKPEPAMEFLLSLTHAQPVQVAVYWDQGRASVYFGVAHVEESHKRQFTACLNDLRNEISRTLDEKAPATAQH